ncbi:hypothetical protein HF521_020020 [Silurus meridionalis]|uniref:Ig-like domain-containing protein n=1 Tax=Silurus meridionalis TaxID=175797 RepID=A0A8T0BMV4_SILME|nr:hypothetical protein HF521_020020 [Silurus meridionalis]
MLSTVLVSLLPVAHAQAKPTVTLRSFSWSLINSEDTITLSCEPQDSREWEFAWYINSHFVRNVATKTTTFSVNVNNAGETVYQCGARWKSNYRYYDTELSDPVKITAKAKPQPSVRVNPQSFTYTEKTITLSCELQETTGWKFFWYKNPQLVNNVATNTLHITVDNAGEPVYQCRASRIIYNNHNNYDFFYTGLSDFVKIKAKEKHKPTVRVNHQSFMYTGDTITLSCELQGTIRWDIFWYKNSQLLNTVHNNTLSVRVDNAGETVYQCWASRTMYSSNSYNFFYTGLSDSVKIKAKERPQAVLSVSPQNWLTEGDSVTLSCEVTDSSTDWTFSWYTVVPYRDGVTAIQMNHGFIMYVELLSDSSRGSGGSYTLSPSALHHTGVYVCRGKRGEPVSHILYSNPQPLWISGESPPVSLIISPSRTQHFTRDSLSLSCEDQSNSTGWTVRRYTDSERVLDCSQWGSVTGSTCKFSFLYTFYTGVYWCESESGENSNPVNITVHEGNMILESSVHPVTEGHPLTLHCLYRYTNPLNPQTDFYKDGSVVQNQTTGEMIIHKVSKSDEGFYHCKHPERGESPRSWISVRLSRSGFVGETVGLAVGLSLVFLLIALLIFMILWYYKMKKEKQQKSEQISEQNQSWSGNNDSQSGHDPLQAENENLYATVDQADMSERGETEAESSEATYSQIPKKEGKQEKWC